MIQIVDRDDKPVGAMTITEAHEQGAIHRVVRIMVENPKNKKILLQKRSMKVSRWPGCWDDSAGGHVDKGEDYLQAAKRELYEEIGIKTDGLEEMGGYYSENETPDGVLLKRFNKVYRVFTKADDFDLEESEVSEVRWFTLAEIKGMLINRPDEITDGINDIINRYYS